MKTKIIAVAQVKGGSGRSTLATTLAGELSKRGDTVLIDCDMPQGTSASWYAMRLDAGRTGKLHLDTADSHLDAMQKTELHTGKTQFIVLDGPPRIAELTRAMVLLADLVLVPAGASMADLWATGDVLAMVTEAKAEAHQGAAGLDAASRVHQPSQGADRAGQGRAGHQGAGHHHGLAGGLIDALGAGLTAAETADAQARAEVQALIAEVCAILA